MRAKHLTLLVAVFAIITMMFVSCNSEVAENSAISEPGKELVYASFVDNSKELSFSYNVPAYASLYWRYSAVKQDNYGTYGQTWDGENPENEAFAPVPTDATGPTMGLDGRVGPFSQGKWNFKLEAYRKCTVSGDVFTYSDLVFKGTAENVVLNKNQTNYIAVTVTPAGETGKIKISDAYYEWASSANAGTAQVKLVVTLVGRPDGSNSTNPLTYTYNEPLTKEASENKYKFKGNGGYIAIPVSSTSSEVTTAIPAGVYTATFKIVENTDTPTIDEFVLQTFSLKVYGGLETVISGNLTEGLSKENYFSVPEQTIAFTTSDNNGSASFDVPKTPSTATGVNIKTTVVFPDNTLSSNTQHTLTVDVTTIETAETQFVIVPESEEAGPEVAVAAIGLELSKTTVTTDGSGKVTDTITSTVSEFTDYVTITTFIQEGLTGKITVVYNDPNAGTESAKSQPIANIDGISAVATSYETDEVMGDKLGYSVESGKLRFKTDHFSDFYVKTDGLVAQNVNSGKYYSTLQSAVDAALAGQTVQVIKDTIDLGTTGLVISGTDLTLDLNGKIITGAVNGKLVTINESASVTITDSSNPSTGHIYNTDTSAQGHDAVCNYGTATINGGKFGGDLGDLGYTRGGGFRNLGNAVINGGVFYGLYKNGGYAYGLINGAGSSGDATMTINKVTVYGAGQGALAVNSGVVTVNGGSFYADGYYAVWITNNGHNTSVTINDGSFNSTLTSGPSVLYASVDDGNQDASDADIKIYGGTYTYTGSATNKKAVDLGYKTGASTHTWGMTLYGGTYSIEPESSYIAPGYVAVPNTPSEGYWTVTPLVTVKHGEKTTGYGDLQSAFDDTQDGDIVTIHGNIDLGTPTSTPLTTKEGVEFTLDLNGHTVSAAIDGNGNRYLSVRVLKNRGEMTLTDLSEGEVVGSIRNTAESGNDCTRTVENAEGASLTVKNAKIYSSIGQALINYGEVTLNSGAVIMSEGHRGGNYDNGAVAIDLRGTGTISITDGATVYSKEAPAMYAFSGGQVDINGGDFHCDPSMGLFTGDAASSIVVTGGTYNYDPTMFKAWYCSLQNEGGLYTVEPASCSFVSVDSFESLKEALQSATDDNPYEITLTDSITISSDSVVISKNALLKINSDVTVSVVDGGLLDNRNIIENNGTINVTGTGFLSHPLNIVNSGENAKLTGYSDNYYDYDGDHEDDYVITNPMDLQWLAVINSGDMWDSLNVYLANDIEFPEEVEFQPIPAFSGVFDGKTHSISKLVINTKSSYTGVFECLASATIKNLTLIDEEVTALSGATGGIAGWITEETFFESIVLNGSITVGGSAYGLGGFVGDIDGTDSSKNIHFVDCVNNLTISGPNAAFAGGFYATSSGQVSPLFFINCTNNGNVSAGIYYAGSIGGYGSDTTTGYARIYNHVNTGELSAPNNTGVMGYSGEAKVYSAEEYDCVAGINGAFIITPKQTN